MEVYIYTFKDRATGKPQCRIWETSQEKAEESFNKEFNNPSPEISVEPAPLRRVVCAANRHKKTKRIICAPRHADAIMRSQVAEGERYSDFEQGFVDQFCLWMSREEAYIVAKKRNQIIWARDVTPGTLFSETLY